MGWRHVYGRLQDDNDSLLIDSRGSPNGHLLPGIELLSREYLPTKCIPRALKVARPSEDLQNGHATCVSALADSTRYH